MIRAVTIMTITMAIALVLHTIGWADKSATQPIHLKTLAEVDVNALDEEGGRITKRIPTRKVVP